MCPHLSVGRKKPSFGVADSANVLLVDVHSPVWTSLVEQSFGKYL